MDVNQTYCGDHFATYTLETNIMCVNYTLIKIFLIKRIKKVYSSVVFSIFTILGRFYDHKKKFCIHQQSFPTSFQFPQPLVTINLLSVSRICLFWTFHINGIILYVVFILASFTQHNVFRVQPCCQVYQDSIPFYGRIILHCMAR